MNPTRVTFIFAWALFCSLSCSNADAVVEEAGADVDCPGPGEAFVTTCSGSGSESPVPNDEIADEPDDLDESDLVNEVLEDSRESDPRSQKSYSSGSGVPPANDDCGTNDFSHGEAGFCDATGGAAAMRQLKQTTSKLMRQYYDPLPNEGKCAIGTVCGFVSSRLAMGAANRAFRLAGATWVLSEAMHASGFCEEAMCVPEEARPWVAILRRALIKQCTRVRVLARRIWDQDRIREIVQKDEMVAGGFAAGAFIGFVV